MAAFKVENLTHLCDWLDNALREEREALRGELENRHSRIMLSFRRKGEVLAKVVDDGDDGLKGHGKQEYAPDSNLPFRTEQYLEGRESWEPDMEIPNEARREEGGGQDIMEADKSEKACPELSILSGRRAPEIQTQGLWLVHRIVISTKFEVTFAILIILNAVVMGLESQYSGNGLGHKLKYPNYNVTAEEMWPGVKPALEVLNHFFGSLFTLEVLMKMIGLHRHFIRDCWNWFDTIIITIWLVDVMSSGSIQFPMDPMLLRLARLARLLRLAKLVRHLHSLDPLFLMMTTLKGSVAVLVWAFVLLLVCQTMFAFVLNQLLVTSAMGPDSSLDLALQQEIFKYFGTFTRSMLSMFELTLGNWIPITRLLLDHVSEYYMIFSLAHKLTMGFSVIAVINGIFIQETFKVAACDDTLMLMQKERAMLMHLKKMEKLFRAADNNVDGIVDKDEFHQIMDLPQVRHWLEAQDLVTGDADSLFELLDRGHGLDHPGLSAKDLVTGVALLKGPARSIDLISMMRMQTQPLIDKIARMDEHLSSMHYDMFHKANNKSTTGLACTASSEFPQAELAELQQVLASLQQVLLSRFDNDDCDDVQQQTDPRHILLL